MPEMSDAEWREEVMVVCTDALNYFANDGRRLWGVLNRLVEERPEVDELVALRDILATSGAVFVQQIAAVQSVVVKK